MNEDQAMTPISDHDILIELRSEMRGLRGDLKTLNTTTASQIGGLQASKLDKDEFAQFRIADEKIKDDHEKRIRRLERWVLLGLGALGVVEFLVQIYTTYFHP